MTRVVADASVALKWFFFQQPGEDDVEPALALLRAVAAGQVALVQPPHFIAEVGAVLVRETAATAQRDLLRLLAVEQQTIADPDHYALALTLAARHRQHVFDTLYHALALRVDGAVLVTADERYERSVRAEGRIVRLADFVVPA